jgi:hypothetical protein
MAYTIINSDGTVLLTLADGTVDQLATSLTLIGKNVNSYGQYYNDNLIAMLENFASDGIQPRSPLVGQLWYNKSDGRVYVYGLDSIFKPVAVSLVSPSEPTLANIGDIWIDTTNKQLWFTSDGHNFTLAGPPVSSATGTSFTGWVADSIADNSSGTNIVASLYNNNTLVAMASTTTFTFASPFKGMTSVQKGINLNNSIPGIRFVGTATNSDAVTTLTNFLTSNFLQISPVSAQHTTNRLDILNDTGLYVGAAADLSLVVNASYGYLKCNTTNKPLNINALSSVIGDVIAIQVNPNVASKPAVNFFPALSTSSANVNINADVTVTGNFTVYGTATNVQSVNLEVKDKNVQLAFGQGTPLDSFADGGGITLIGTTNHNLSWTQSYNHAWQVDDNFNLVSSTSSFMIGGQSVITSSTLGTVITSAPGLVSFGTLNHLTVTNITITSSTISVGGTNASLYLTVPGSGSVDVAGKKITSLSTCTVSSDAANKGYVDSAVYLVGTKGFVLSMDVTGMVNPNTDIIPYLNRLLPVTNPSIDAVFDLPDGVRTRVLCSQSQVNIPTQTLNINLALGSADKNGLFSVQQVVTDVAGQLTGFSQVTTTTFTVREFRVISGVWSFIGIIP